jgi:hypothetical protein
MSSLFQKLETANALKSSTFQKLSELQPHRNYVITKMKNLSTQYGPALLVCCQGERIPVLFPRRFYDQLGGSNIDETNHQLDRENIIFQVGDQVEKMCPITFINNSSYDKKCRNRK